MDVLRKEGWFVNETAVGEFFENGIPKSYNEISKVLIDEDLRDFGEPSILNLHKKEEGSFSGPCVLQLVRYRNVCVPRIREEFGNNEQPSSIIRLFLTDGHISISAILLEPINGINADTPPGTKLLLTGNTHCEGLFLILQKSNVRILGGRVDKLIEKWNVEKNSIRAEGFKKSSATSAPKWISFGKKGANAQQAKELSKNFKANDAIQTNKKEDDGDEDEFVKNREQAIKDLKSKDEQQTKVFSRPNVAPPPPSEPKTFEPKVPKPREEKKPMNKRRGRKNSEDEDDIVGDYPNLKPSAAPTLFDFMTGVVGTNPASNAKPVQQPQHDKKNAPYERNERNKSGGKDFQNQRSSGPGFSRGGQQNRAQFNQTRPSSNQDNNMRQMQKDMGNLSLGQNQNRGNRNDSKKTFENREQKYDNKRYGENSRSETTNQPRNQTQKPPQKYEPQGRQNNQFKPTQGQNEYRQGQDNSSRNNAQNRGFTPNSNQAQRNPSQHQSHPNQRPQQSRQAPASSQAPNWKVGSKCLAPWDDGNIYPATIVEMYPNRICAIRYNEYGNIASIPIDVLIFP